MTSEYKNLEGIGGWLLLVAFGLIASPIRMAYDMYQSFGIFSDGTWELFTSEKSTNYLFGFATWHWAGSLANLAMFCGWIYSAYLFFSKRRSFPRWYVWLLAVNTIVILADALVYWHFFRELPGYDIQPFIFDVAKVAISSAIWIPYTLVSVRVETTFVHT